jgi:hypothetical protein
MKKLFLLLVLSGVIFLCTAIFLSAKATKFEREGIEIQAEIVEIIREYDVNYKEEITVYVRYKVENTTFTRKLDYYASDLFVGDIVPIYYLPENPSSISYAKTQFLPAILFYVGAGVCFVFSIGIAIRDEKGLDKNEN